MTLNTFKTNWFSVALVLLVLAAIFRNSSRLSLQKYFSGEKAGETQLASMPKKQTTFGLGAEPARRTPVPIEVDQATAAAFLKRFAPVAVSERKKFGVPAAVLLATAFLNSHVGLKNAATEANNFFALPCSGDWEGESTTLEDQCLRKYETPWASWRDFSIYMSSQAWFGGLRQSAGKDWQKWSAGLAGKEISPISNFGQKLSEVIAYYHLYDLDQQ